MEVCKHRVMDKCKKDHRPCRFSKECFEAQEVKPMTNGDRIRAMSDEELAKYLLSISTAECPFNYEDCGEFKTCEECWNYRLSIPAKQ